MYFLHGPPRIVSAISQEDDDCFQDVCSNRERVLLIVLRKYTILIWQIKPLVQLAAYRRSKVSVTNAGHNVRALWRPDSSAIVVQTSLNGLIFFQIEVGADEASYVLKDINNSKRNSDELFQSEQIPYLSIIPSASIIVGNDITCLEALRDHVMISCKNGTIQRISWNGTVNEELTIPINAVPFSVDFPQSKKSYLDQNSVYIVDLDYSFLLGGFSLVLSNGRGALMTSSFPEFMVHSVQCVWVPQEASPFLCTAVNHKFRLMAFGCANAQGVIYCIEDQTEGIQLTHRLELESKDCPEVKTACGAVSNMSWTPDGCALAMVWEKGSLALWSTFGALLVFCKSLIHEGIPRTISSLDWGIEGYSLWLLDTKVLFSYGCVRSTLTTNNCATNRIAMLLQSEDSLFLNTGDRLISPSDPKSENQYELFSNKAWINIQYPHRYIASNWPVRMAVVDAVAEYAAIAGRSGFAIYSIPGRKWKTFSNENAEKAIIVTGGLLWWKDFLLCGCSNTKTQTDEIRVYNRNRTLDHNHVTTTTCQAPILFLNTFRDMLLVFSADYMLTLAGLTKAEQGGAVHIHPLQLISIENICSHPNCVISVDLTPVRAESGHKRLPETREVESLLINVSGRLFIIQRDNPSEPTKPRASPDNGGGANMIMPVLLSSCVETLWVHPSSQPPKDKPHLNEALWMFCGAHGMKVWLPLFPKEKDKANMFLTRRMMLPIKLKTFPLSVLFDEAIVHGTESEISFEASSESENYWLPNFVLQRTSEVYLPQVLRQLLRRNLGAHALEIARTCTKLPYFNHSLELLLHQVLEEEGTSSEPTPDPLLPSIVAFVQEFPVFLQTIAHCARKSDIALWPRLFAEAGEPVHLFRECMEADDLQVAASFLIVLNTTLSPSMVKKCASQLVDRAKEKLERDLVVETSRFLRALELEEAEFHRKTPEQHAHHKVLARNMSEPSKDLTTPATPQGTVSFKYGPVVRARTISESAHDSSTTKRNSVGGTQKAEMVRTYSVASPPNLSGHLNHSPRSSPVDNGNGIDVTDSAATKGPGRQPGTNSAPSVSSKQTWSSRRRFPGYAQQLGL